MDKERFNLQPFNLEGGIQPIRAARYAVEIVECVAGSKIIKTAVRNASDGVLGRIRLTYLLIASPRVAADVVNEAAIMRIISIGNNRAEESISGVVHVSKRIFSAAAGDENVLGRFHLGKIMRVPRDTAEEIWVSADLSKILPSVRLTAEFVNGVVSFFAVKSIDAEIEVTIQPGQVLKINSGNYTAFLDSLNVLDRYSGGWIFVTPNTLEIKVQTSVGDTIEATVEYLEQFI